MYVCGLETAELELSGFCEFRSEELAEGPARGPEVEVDVCHRLSLARLPLLDSSNGSLGSGAETLPGIWPRPATNEAGPTAGVAEPELPPKSSRDMARGE